MFKNTKRIYVTLILVIILVVTYFFWPRTIKISNEDQIFATISKDMSDYELNKQELSDLIKIIKKSKFRHGVSRPDRMFADRSTNLSIGGGMEHINLQFYYDTDKTYIYASMSDGMFLNVYYRISNKDEIKKYIENIVSSKENEFKEFPVN